MSKLRYENHRECLDDKSASLYGLSIYKRSLYDCREKIVNIFRRGHFSVRCLLHAASQLELNLALLVIHHAFIQLRHLGQLHHFFHSFYSIIKR